VSPGLKDEYFRKSRFIAVVKSWDERRDPEGR
jgi:hypothetical protein